VDRTLIAALEERDADAAKRFIEDESDARRVLAMYHGAIRHAYWSNKDLAMVVALGRHAIAYGTAGAHDDALKPITYDIGSFCWPGWDEPGITVDETTLAFGADVAALNLDLALRLQRPPLAQAMAHWLVGAYELATGRRDDAARYFERALALARTSADRPTELLMSAYLAVAEERIVSAESFACIEDGPALIAQVETAARVFADC
jgi:tetratricopeptide (TPR) repeat protein